MPVYVDLSEKLTFCDKPILSETCIEIGKTYQNFDNDQIEKYIKGKIINIFKSYDMEIEEKYIDNLLKVAVYKNKIELFDTSIFAGEYVVINSGIKRFETCYVSGWKVIAKKLKEGKYDKFGEEVSFYQTGAFTALIPPSKIQLKSKL